MTLEVEGLSVSFGDTEVVTNLSFRLEPGRCLAIVGESGSGKSVTARSLIGLPGAGATVTADRLALDDRDLRGLSDRAWRRVRGKDVGFVLQDALVSLDPLRPIAAEIADALRLHTNATARQRGERVHRLLADVGVPDPANRARQRSGELSGGLRQRALIASAIALDPPVLIADEPTTALDATVQAQILALLESFKKRGTAILLISHDLAVVSRIADDIAVMRAGEFVEIGAASEVIARPQHEYTRQLIAAVPTAERRGERLSLLPSAVDAAVLARAHHAAPAAGDAPVLVVDGVSKSYRRPDGSTLQAVDGVSFELARGETLGIVGESGSGKSTLARLALALERPDAGDVRLFGEPWSAVTERERRPLRRRVGVVYQDPLSSFDPRWSVGRILADALTDGRDPRPAPRRAQLEELLDLVGLAPSLLERRPLRLSGGQRQRVAIARALAHGPDVLVCDEPVSALDVSVQAQVLDLLTDLQRALGLSYLFISHDLGVVGHVSDRVLVMKDGRVVESGAVEQLLTAPAEEYTRELLAASPHFSVA